MYLTIKEIPVGKYLGYYKFSGGGWTTVCYVLLRKIRSRIRYPQRVGTRSGPTSTGSANTNHTFCSSACPTAVYRTLSLADDVLNNYKSFLVTTMTIINWQTQHGITKNSRQLQETLMSIAFLQHNWQRFYKFQHTRDKLQVWRTKELRKDFKDRRLIGKTPHP